MHPLSPTERTERLRDKVAKALALQSRILTFPWTVDSANGQAMTTAVMAEILPALYESDRELDQTHATLRTQMSEIMRFLDDLRAKDTLIAAAHALRAVLSTGVVDDSSGTTVYGPRTCVLCGASVSTVETESEATLLRLLAHHLTEVCEGIG